MRTGLIAVLLAFSFNLAVAGNSLEIVDPWIPEAPPGRMMAGYMQLVNHGEEAITLVDARSPDFGRVEIHSMTMDDGIMRMRREDELTIEPGARVRLERGGLHLMLMQPERQFEVGDVIDITLVDSNSQGHDLQATVKVRRQTRQ